jgi:hypothetical protein
VSAIGKASQPRFDEPELELGYLVIELERGAADTTTVHLQGELDLVALHKPSAQSAISTLVATRRWNWT